MIKDVCVSNKQIKSKQVMHDNTGQTEEKIKGRLYGTFGSLRNADQG